MTTTFALRPLHSLLIIKLDAGEERTSGGLYIPATGQDAPPSGVVVAAGPGRFDNTGALRPLDAKPGDRVLVDRAALSGTAGEIEVDGTKYRIVDEEDVLAVYSNNT